MTSRFTLALAAVGVLALLAAPVCPAQRRSGGYPGHGFGVPRYSASYFGDRRGRVPFGYYLGDYPLFYDDSYAQPVQDSAPQFVVIEPHTAAAGAQPLPKASPLLIELQGDRYVRYGGAAQSSAGDATQPGPLREPRSTSDSIRPPSPLAPTILVYRDGHREEVPDYAIFGGIMYAHRSDSDAQPGYGLRNIQLSALDIPGTIRANQENGINFVLPAGPNEVVTRP